MTYSRVGRFKSPDPTPHCVFRNQTYHFKNGKQILDLQSYCDDFEIVNHTEDDVSTEYLRRNARSLGRYFNMARLKQTPMFTFEDGASLLLPLDNDLGLDYLTYRDPRYKDFIGEFIDELFKSGDPICQDAARILPTDYSISAPFASMIRRDGRMKVKSGLWSAKAKRCFCEHLTKLFRLSFLEACSNVTRFAPPKNASKSIGFFTRLPDGNQYKPKQDYFVPEGLYSDKLPIEENEWARPNHYPFKKAWLESGALFNNFLWFMENCDRFDNEDVYLTAFSKSCCSVHTEAYRLNNADKTLNDLTKGFQRCCEEGFFKKQRVVSWENSNGSFSSGLLRDQEYSNDLRKLNGAFGTLLKKRPMFPGPNATFSLPFIFLCRLLVGPFEEKPCGFPSLNVNTLSRYNRVLSGEYSSRCIVTFDRKTSEQFITDNIDEILELFPYSIKRILNGALKSVVPSLYGPRVVKGLLSGTAFTTFINLVVGLFECCRQVCAVAFGDVSDEHLSVVIDKVFTVQYEQLDSISINGLTFITNLGTDDQIFYVLSKDLSQQDLTSVIETNIKRAKSCEGVSLDLEVSETSATVFGLLFHVDRVTVNPVLGLSKIFLFEKDTLGDNIAVKYAARMELLQQYIDLVQFLYKKHGFGSISTYQIGSDNYFKQLGRFGFPGFVDSFNIWSASERIIMQSYLEKYSIDPANFVDKYSQSELQPFLNVFKQLPL